MRARIVVVIGLLASWSSAQSTTTNVFDIWPGSADAVARAGLSGTSDGDVLVEMRGFSFHAAAGGNNTDAFCSVGDMNSFGAAQGGSGLGTINGFRGRFQDQDGATTESFDFVIAAEGAVAGTPAAGSAALFRTESLSTPPGVGPVAWNADLLFANEVDVIPASATWYLGAGIPSNAAWNLDGLSIVLASFNGLGPPFPNAGDNPVDPNGPATATWIRDHTLGFEAPSLTPSTYALRITTPAPVLHWGADIVDRGRIGPNPNFGMAGVHPDTCGVGNVGRTLFYPNYLGRGGTGDGLWYRVRANQAVGTSGFLLLTVGFSSFGSPVYLNNPGFRGPLCLDLQVIVNGGAIPPIASNGRVTAQLAARNLLCPFPGDTLAAQVLLVTPTANWFSNGAKTHF